VLIPQTAKEKHMFLHQVKMNWKKYRRLVEMVLLFAAARAYVELRLGWAPLNYLAVLKLALGLLAFTVAWAFLKTLWELGMAYHRKLCTFYAALRKFCREYWSSKAAAV
jgi:hypothetical protein